MNTRLGCLTGSGILAALLTILVITGITLGQGGVLFNPGPLNALVGEVKGGVRSHAELLNQCRACHAAFWKAETMADRCNACHTEISVEAVDPHSLHGVVIQNNSGLSCRNCHTEHNGPDGVLTVMDMNGFPHEALGYALTGHQRLANDARFQCSDCHRDNTFTSFDQATCDTCHRQMDSTFTVAHTLMFGKDCLACHDGVDTYGDDFNHDLFAFPLIGKHIGLECSQCHLSARSLSDLEVTPAVCFSCHAMEDTHQSRFGTDCAVCHTPEGWKPALFDHHLAAFKLEGKHIEVACEACHVNGIYRGTPLDCYSCHVDDDAHLGSFGVDCAACHTPKGWLPAQFDHNLADFKLVGKHIQVTCETCHQNGIYKGTPTECYSCHAQDDAHNGQYGSDCATCHTSWGWLPATFDHSRSKFPLTGAHVNLRCSQCHINNIYRGTPTACVSCHRDPAFHAGLFGTNCSECHNTSTWIPAIFNRAHSFPINHGNAATCRDCHTVSLSTWTCYTCHNQAEMQDKHKEIGIFTDCLSCHPTGQKEEGGGGDD